MKKILFIFLFLFLSINHIYAESYEEIKMKDGNAYILKNIGSYDVELYKNNELIDTYSSISELKISSNKENFIFYAKNKDRNFIVTNGIKGETFYFIKDYLSTISDNSIEYAFVGIKDELEFQHLITNWEVHYYFVKNGKSIDLGSLDSISKLQYIPNSNKVIFFGEKNGKKFMYVDGIKGEEFDDINMADFSFDSSTVYYTDGNTRKYNNYSINGKYYFYCGKKDGKWYAVINGVKGEPFDGIYDGLVLHPSVGDEYSYIGISGKNTYLIKDGKKIDISFADDIIYDSFQYIPNSNKIMFFASSKGKKYIVVDGIKGEEFDDLYIAIQDFGIVGVYFSKDGNNYFYFGKKDGKWSLIKNTNKILTFDADYIENDFDSSRNGEKYVFTFLKGNNTYYLVSNGIISDKNYKLIVKPVLDDFNNMAYVTKNNNVISLVINGKTIKTYGDEGVFYNIKYNSKDNSFVYFYYTLHWLSSNTVSKLEGVINYNLSTKKITEYKNTLNDLKVVDSFLGKYKVLPVEKKYKIEDKLNELIKNLKPGTKNYGVIYKLLQTIK